MRQILEIEVRGLISYKEDIERPLSLCGTSKLVPTLGEGPVFVGRLIIRLLFGFDSVFSI